MKIENIEKLKGWTPPGNPSINPIITEVERGIFDYTFWIRYQGRSYEMVLLRDYEMTQFGKQYKIAFKVSATPHWWETMVHGDVLSSMRNFYDTFHTMLYRISIGTFEKHYGTNVNFAK
jgi:hypothetical protein